MASLNKVFIIGNLVQEPELRYTQVGQAVATLRIASSRRYKTKLGELKEDTLFIDVEVWGRQAENCGEFLSKGRPVFIEGRLAQDTWETQDSEGNTVRRSKFKIIAQNVQFLPSGKREETSDATPLSPEGTEDASDSSPEEDIPDDIPF